MSFSTASAFRSNQIKERPLIGALAGIFAAFWLVSFAGTTDLVNWWIENLLVIIFTATLVFTFRRFAFSDLSYALIFIFLLLHVYGAKYAYADNPFGFYLQHEFGTARNPYDRIVHSSFGLLMAYPMRELLMRNMKTSNRWAWILPIELVLSLSGLFELIEWSVADIFFPAHGMNYVGSQGDVWDAQKDMFLASSGAATVMLLGRMLKEARVGVRLRLLQSSKA
jgi:putative membrane protein